MKENNKEMISIVVPAYNAVNVIGLCIDSILKSTYKDFELVIVNDGSKDNTLEILQEYAKKDQRIRVIDRENGGQSEARNTGLRASKGKYVMFIDSDDYLDPDYLEKMHECLIKNDADVVVSGYTCVDQEHKPYAVNKYKNTRFSQFSMLMPWGKLIKKDLLDKNNIEFENINYWEDHVFSFAIYSHASKVVTAEDLVGYNYYYNVNGLTKNNFLAFKVDVLPAHRATLKAIDKDDYKENKELWDYTLLKGCISHFLESGKNATVEHFIKVDKEVLKWYEENVRKLNKIRIPREEKTSIKFVIRTYLFLRKVGLLKLFLRFYCNGK